MNKKGFSIWEGCLIFILLLIVGWFITNNIYVTYDSISFDGSDYYCNNENIELQQNDLNKLGFEFRQSPSDECYYQCFISDEYRNIFKKKNVIYCESDIPICDCKASFYSYYIYDLFKQR